MAKLCRYYGMTPNDILMSDPDDISQLIAAMPKLEAYEQIVSSRIAQVPNLKKSSASKYWGDLRKVAFAPIINKEDDKQAVELTPNQMMGLFNG